MARTRINQTSRWTLIVAAAGWAVGASAVSAQCNGAWTRIAARVGPAAEDAATAFDPSRNEVVWFGGRIPLNTISDETWVRANNKWTHAVVGLRPGARADAAMVFDSLRNRCILGPGVNSTTFVNDTWARTGGMWSQVSATGPTPARNDYGLAYDPIRDRVVLFGGLASGGRQNDTWEWDGAAWNLIAVASPPPVRSGPSMTFDSTRGVCVLFGGQGSSVTYRNDTWEWNGVVWTQRFPANSPPARRNGGFAHDAARGRTVLFSGFVNGASPQPNDTWEWDGANWTLVAPATALRHTPNAVRAASMCYDTVRQRAFLHTDDENGAWEWNGSAWAHVESTPWDAPYAQAALDPVNRKVIIPGESNGHVFGWTGAAWARLDFASSGLPRAFPGFAMTTDTVRNRALQFGVFVDPGGPDDPFDIWDGLSSLAFAGSRPSDDAYGAFAFDRARERAVYVHTLAQTWLWDGAAWVNANVTTPGMSDASAAYDPVRERVVLFGGRRNNVALNETWEWNGVAWTQRFLAHSPAARSRHRVVYDEDCQRIFLFGGRAGQNLSDLTNDAWSYDGNDWTQIVQSNPPSARENFAMAYDPVRHATVVYGGSTFDRDVYMFSTLPPCPADTNGDRVITFADLNTVLSQFGQSAIPGLLDGDVNDDGAVNFADLNLVLSSFGLSC